MTSISTPIPRVDAVEKASGTAEYVADLTVEGMLYARTVRSTIPRGTIVSVAFPETPDGYTFVDWRDIPTGGSNSILMIEDDWPVFAREDIRFLGQTIALVVGPDRQVLDSLVSHVSVTYDRRSPAYTVDESLALVGGSIHGDDNVIADCHIQKGDWARALEQAERVIEEEFTTGFQEHVYMEPQGCLMTREDGVLTLYASTQCPFYLRKSIAHTLGWAEESIRVVQAHTGGGFGGKEHYPDVLATSLAVAVLKTGAPVQLILERHEDMSFTPKRHPARVAFRTAVDLAGNVLGMSIDTLLNAGAYLTCSEVVLQRAVFSATGAYDIPNVEIRGRAMATNTVPSDAFRGFGAPQALFAIELHMDHLAAAAGVEPLAYKRRYFLANGDATVSGGTVHDEVLLETMLGRIEAVSCYSRRRVSMPPWSGIGMSFFNHGCGFTGSGEQKIIKGRVAIEKYGDGVVRILAAGVDMGQGIATTFRKVVARVLDLPISRVLYDRPDTAAVPNSGPTCASRSIMVVGYLLQEAARRLKDQWRDGAEQSVSQGYNHPAGMRWDQARLSGDAYPGYGWGINVVEVSIDPLTYEIAVGGIWSIYDVGIPIDQRIVEGQAHGGMIQALGYAMLENLEIKDGRFRQVTMADYSIPTSLDFPAVHTDFVENPYPFGPFGAKGAGELVFDGAAPALALAVQQALGKQVHSIPLTPEAIMGLVE
jgi:CO/xanthine dehydrogenase Mo-binding subunit